MSIKRNFVVLAMVVGIFTAGMVGCSSSADESVKTESGKQESESKKESHVLVKDIEFIDAKILEPDSIDTRYFSAQIKNNSEQKIISYTIEMELDNSETSYFSVYDTLLPGDTSSIAECFGATTGVLEDMKAKKISILALDENNYKMYIDYDVKLDKYTVMKGDKFEEVTSPVTVGQLEFVDPLILEPDSIGTIYFETKIKNNSEYPITGVSVELELDNGETSYLSTFDTLLPGDTSTKAECFGATTGNIEDMKAKKISITVLDENQEEVYIDYDVKLNQYEVY